MTTPRKTINPTILTMTTLCQEEEMTDDEIAEELAEGGLLL
jgi:hypothetical protein